MNENTNLHPNPTETLAEATERYMEEEYLQSLQVSPEFHIESLEDLKWLTKKLFDLDSELQTLQLERKAVIENYDRLISRCQNLKEFLLKRFGGESKLVIEAYAPPGTKSILTPYGRIGLRDYPGRITVKPGIGTEFMEATYPYAVVEEVKKSVLVSKLTPEDREDLMRRAAEGKAPGVEVTPADPERVTFTSGL